MGDQAFAIRRSQRHDVALPARYCIAPSHAAQVRLSSGSGARDGWLDAGLVNLSSGGVGLVTPVFVPRRCLINVRIWGSNAPEAHNEAPILEVAARVQRIVMTDRRPAYLVGTAFEALTAETTTAVESLLALVETGRAA